MARSWWSQLREDRKSGKLQGLLLPPTALVLEMTRSSKHSRQTCCLSTYLHFNLTHWTNYRGNSLPLLYLPSFDRQQIVKKRDVDILRVQSWYLSFTTKPLLFWESGGLGSIPFFASTMFFHGLQFCPAFRCLTNRI